jgi:hypothetical protein
MLSSTFDALCGKTSRFDCYRTRRNRLAAAVSYLGVLAAFLLITWFVDENLLAIPLVALYMLTTVVLYAGTRGITESSATDLDEHQIDVRNAAHKAAYLPGIMIAFIGGILVAKLSDTDTAFEVGLFIALWGTITALPTIIVAWRLPSELVDEE